MKIFAILAVLVTLLASCGGATDPTVTKDTRTGANGSAPTFEPPPTPGSN